MPVPSSSSLGIPQLGVAVGAGSGVQVARTICGTPVLIGEIEGDAKDQHICQCQSHGHLRSTAYARSPRSHVTTN